MPTPDATERFAALDDTPNRQDYDQPSRPPECTAAAARPCAIIPRIGGARCRYSPR